MESARGIRVQARRGKLIALAIGLVALLLLLLGIGVAAGSAKPVAGSLTPAGDSTPIASGRIEAESLSSSASPSAEPPAATASEPAPASSSWIALLASLPVSTEQSEGYDRELFEHWIDTDSDGCNARKEVLIVESLEPVSVGSRCALAGGAWLSLYDGVRESDSGRFDIDHFVPLKEAWDSGAWAWDPATRAAFANDLDYAGSLIAVTASSNRSKGEQDPSQWLPPAADVHCQYVATWLQVKVRWSLAVDQSERSAIERVLSGCDESSLAAVPVAALASVSVAQSEPSPAAPAPAPEAPVAVAPRFDTCRAANAAGYGDFVAGSVEYEWYIDRDKDGVACER